MAASPPRTGRITAFARNFGPVVVALGVGAAFIGGIPGLPPASGLGVAIPLGEPFVEIIGHYVPTVRGPDGPIAVGAGPQADLRLTETDVAEQLAHITVDDHVVHYVHDSTANSAAFYTRSDGLFAGVATPPDAVIPAIDGERIVWSDAALTGDDTSRACDPAATGAWTGATLDLVDATGLWMHDDRGEVRTLEVPAIPGAWRPVGTGALMDAASGLWLTPTVPTSVEVPPGSAWIAGRWSRWQAGEPPITPAPLDAAFANGIGLDRAFPGVVDPELALSGDRFVKPDAYVRLDDGAPVPIGVTGDSEPINPAFHVFRRKPHAESSVPLVWAAVAAAHEVLGEDTSNSPKIGRTPGFAGHLYRCVDGRTAEIGTIDLHDGDTLLAGRTTWMLGRSEGHRIELTVTEPPVHRAHALASLSAGHLRAVNAQLEVPPCADTPEAPRRSLVLRGTTGPESVPAGVEPVTDAPIPAPGQQIARIPLPAWAARAHSDVQEHGALEVDLVELCADRSGSLVVLADRSPPGLPLIELSGARIAPGGTFGVAGHTLRYAPRRPILEQVLPIGGFLLLVHAMCLLAGVRLARHTTTRGTAAEKYGPPLVVAGFCAALTAGALLQLRMAASAELLGSSDYLQRHLLTGYMAAVGMYGGVDLALAWPDESGLRRIARLAAVGRLATTALLGWLLVDLAVFDALRWQDSPAGPAVWGDVYRTIALVAGAAAVCWVAPLILALAPVATAVAAALRRLSDAIPRRVVPEDAVDVTGSGPSRLAHLRALALGALGAPGDAVWPLIIGAVILAVGVMIGGSGRSLFGFDLKLAEFAPLPVGIGLAGLLVNWSRVGSSWGRIAVVLGTLAWLGALTGVVVVFYALRGDLGPLMVLVPAILLTIGAWVMPWRAGATGAEDVRERAVVLFGYVMCMAVGFFVVYRAVPTVEAHLTEIPSVGTHVQRAVQRFDTYGATWYTEGGHWSTTANWIAAGYYEDVEHYVSNLHSDLAFVAVMQSFHPVRALLLLGVFTGMVLVLLALGESLLARAEAAWAKALRGLSEQDREGRRRYARDQVPVFLQAGATGYFLIFTACYLACETIVHVGTCFNTLPQTGITLPWVSSGGSASVGFAILLGVALARGVKSGTRLDDQL